MMLLQTVTMCFYWLQIVIDKFCAISFYGITIGDFFAFATVISLMIWAIFGKIEFATGMED